MVINMKWNTRIDKLGPMDRQIKYLLLTIVAKKRKKVLIWLGIEYREILSKINWQYVQ